MKTGVSKIYVLTLALFVVVTAQGWCGGGQTRAAGNARPGTGQARMNTSSPTTGGRYALVIGNGEYKNIEKLTNTVNDAQDITEALKELGFDVDLRLNVGEIQFGAAIDSYVAKLSADSNSEGFFWYAGHGVQIRDQNYLLPVDANIESERTLQRNSFSLDELLSDLEGAHNKVNVVILDACRNNPLPSSARGAGGTRGLAAVQDVPSDLFVMFSTAPGDTAEDGKGRRNSPFAEAFLKYIDSAQPVALMASDVINETMSLTSNAQRPFSRGSIISDKTYSLNPAGAAPAYTPEDQAQSFYKEGMARFNAKEWDGAIFYFTEAVRLNLKTRDVYFYRARAYENKGNINQAIADLGLAISKDWSDGEAIRSRGALYIGKGDYDRAIADFSQAVARNPKDAESYNYRGVAYFRKADYDQAIVDWTKAVKLDPKFATAYANRGNAYYNKADYDKAIADYTKVVELDPKYAYAYNSRGDAYNKKSDYDRAIEDWTKAVELDPKYAAAYTNRGYAYYNKADYDKAIADFTKVVELDPKFATAYKGRGDAYNYKGDYDRAIVDFTKAVELNPKFATAYNNRGLAYYEKGDYDRAIADYTKAVEVDPKFAYAYNGRGLAYYRKADYDKAIADFTKAVELSPGYEPAKNNLEIAKKRGK
ncbi:MAG: tetratricopeptide repeat protein [Spirochaetaceae bacterium]|jgi:tetratricopeptide (TPR) repeat protein|nr:tetratricopeptide repeat protein [Spirochaetaceae bacterium]